MKRVILFSVVALSMSAFGAPGESPADFAVRQPLMTTGEHAFLRVELPDSVYEGAVRPDLGDLRVFNGDGAIVPFAFVPRPAPASVAGPRRELAFFPLSVDTTLPQAADFSIKLRRDPGGTTVDVRARDGTPVAGSRIVGYLIDAGADEKPLVGLQLQVHDASSVNARLRVDASDDLEHWRSIVASAPLLSLEFNGRRLARNRVEFAPQAARYLRLTWITALSPVLASVQGRLATCSSSRRAAHARSRAWRIRPKRMPTYSGSVRRCPSIASRLRFRKSTRWHRSRGRDACAPRILGA